jgi:hypothetical protein
MRTCWACNRDIEDELTVQVDFGLFMGIRTICHICLERADEGDDARELAHALEGLNDEEEDAA